MNDVRQIKRVVVGEKAIDGAGVKLTRVLGHKDVKDFDPFLLLDGFGSDNPDDYIRGFPWHPHRGIETVTYMMRGKVAHGDNLGNEGIISDGDCQWMTSGSGIIHQEMPLKNDTLEGVQLWINLPAKDKMTSPKYRDIKASMIPEILETSGVRVKIISGKYGGKEGAMIADHVKVSYLDVTLPSHSEWTLDLASEDTLFIYILKGKGYFTPENDEVMSEKHAVLFDEGKVFWAKSGDMPVRFLLLSAPPLKEEIAWGGPIVMNTKDELSLAFKEINEGNFIKNSD